MLLAALAAPAAALADVGVDTRDVAPVARIDASGDAVPVGDVNGDGIGDLGLGPFSETAAGRRCEPLTEKIDRGDARNWQDAVQVVFGRPSFGPIDVETVGPGGLRVRCPATPRLEDRGPPGSGTSYGIAVGGSVAGAGDVNGDGLADVAVGSVSAGPRGRPGAGSVHVVFGAREGGEMDARTLGDRGVRIDGPERASELGRSITAVGDVDGDGFGDVALPYRVGAAAPNGRRLGRERLRVAIVFGGFRGGEQIDLASPGARVSTLAGLTEAFVAEIADHVALAGLGDLGGDGAGELAVGAAFASEETLWTRRVAVMRVRRGATIDVRREPRVLTVRAEGDRIRFGAVAPAGDVDGDGRQDLAIAANHAPGELGVRDPGTAVMVVPASAGPDVDVARPGATVRTILGVGEVEDDVFAFGGHLAPLGDVDGDGRPDLAIAQPGATPDCRSGAGVVWVVPGTAGGGTVRIDRAPGAWRIDGARPYAALGREVAAGDVTGDGAPELILPSLPSGDAGVVDVRLLAARRPATEVGRLASPPDCFGARLLTRTLRGLRRGRVVVRVRSHMGTGQPQTLAVRVTIGTARSRPRTRRDFDRFRRSILRAGVARARVRAEGPIRRRVAVRMPRAMRRMVRAARFAFVEVDVEQVSPRGAHATDELLVAR
ncbi:MAG TPA: hypothetical protein VF529_21070 [Solirubrobacteraceae bacterium]